MKEKFKKWAMTLRLRECKDPNCTYCCAATFLDRLAALPDEAPKAYSYSDEWNFLTGDRDYYRDAYFAAQTKIAELEDLVNEVIGDLEYDISAGPVVLKTLKSAIKARS